MAYRLKMIEPLVNEVKSSLKLVHENVEINDINCANDYTIENNETLKNKLGVFRPNINSFILKNEEENNNNNNIVDNKNNNNENNNKNKDIDKNKNKKNKKKKKKKVE